MSYQGDLQSSKFRFFIFILATANIFLAVSGLGSFQIKVLSLQTNPQIRACSSEKDQDAKTPCLSGSISCLDTKPSLTIEACLSHHQLPLPMTLRCTLGQETATLPYDSDVGQLSDTVISIPFSYSWPGGFTLSVTAFLECPTHETREMISKVVIADHISPNHHWTSFLYSQISAEDNSNPAMGSTTYARNSNSPNNKSHLFVSTTQKQSVETRNEVFTKAISSTTSQPWTGQSVDSNGNSSQTTGTLQSDAPSEVSQHGPQIKGAHDSHKVRTDLRGDVTVHAYSHKAHRSKRSSHTSTTQNQRSGSVGEGRRDNTEDVYSVYDAGHFEDTVGEKPSRRNDTKVEEDTIFMSTKAVLRFKIAQMVVAARVVCKENYYGESCSHLCRPRDDILGHYSCSSSGQYVCLQGWTGEDCTQAVCSKRCHPSQGKCTKPNMCTCWHGWYGEHCERCRTRPGCVHGTCHLPGQCMCHKGWTGPLCDVENLFCLEHNPCHHGGTCLHDSSHNYTCACLPGYTGTHCEVPVCHKEFCLHNGVCQVAEGTRYCLCSPPYAGPRCQHRVDLTNLQQSTSSCRGPACTLQNLPQRISDFSPHTSCVGANCDEKISNTYSCKDYLCYNGGNCTLSPESKTPVCDCPFPYTGSQCLKVLDPCENNPCLNNGTCVSNTLEDASFTCTCKPEYSGDLCDYKISDYKYDYDYDYDVCDGSLVCQNGGKCEISSRGGQYFCKCPSGFTGEFCEMDSQDPCKTYTCLNRGSCVVDDFNMPMCVCSANFNGAFCENSVQSLCSQVTCQNGGTCIEHDGEFVCACKMRYEGKFCERKFRRKKTTLRVTVMGASTKSMAIRTYKGISCATIVIYLYFVSVYMSLM